VDAKRQRAERELRGFKWRQGDRREFGKDGGIFVGLAGAVWTLRVSSSVLMLSKARKETTCSSD
jgi:hypothetical protein